MRFRVFPPARFAPAALLAAAAVLCFFVAPRWGGATPPTFLCLTGECHPSIAEAEYVHGPIGSRMCPLCHDQGRPAENLPPSHPPVRIGNVTEQCLLCHEEIAALIGLGSVHTPVADGDCTDCHYPHQADNPFFLKSAPLRDDGKRLVSATCKSCHEPDDPSWYNEFHASEAILDCVVCHNAHASSEEYQLTRYVRDVYLRAMLLDADDLRERGKPEAAATAYSKALSVMPGDVETLLRLAGVQSSLEQWIAATESYGRVLEKQADHVGALVGAGQASSRGGDAAAALGYLNRALEVDPSASEAHLEIGKIYSLRNQYQEAYSSYAKASAIDPDNASIYRLLAETLEALGMSRDAADARRRADELDGR